TGITPDTGGGPDTSVPDTSKPDTGMGMDVNQPPPDTGVDAGMPPKACPTPTIMPNGGAFTANNTITISATNPPASGAILYTVTDSLPSPTGNRTITRL